MSKGYEIVSQVDGYNSGNFGTTYMVTLTASTEYFETQEFFFTPDQDALGLLQSALDNFDQYCIDHQIYGD